MIAYSMCYCLESLLSWDGGIKPPSMIEYSIWHGLGSHLSSDGGFQVYYHDYVLYMLWNMKAFVMGVSKPPIMIEYSKCCV